VTSGNGDIISVAIASTLCFVAFVFFPIAAIWMMFQTTETL